MVHEWEIYNSLKQINTRKASHSADYPSWVTRNNAEVLAKPISNIVNSVLVMGIYPEIWKVSEITPLPKVKNPVTCKDYRPISLLYHISKITEKFMNRELAKYISKDDAQYAYTKSLGTTDALVKFVTDVSTSLDKSTTYGVQSLYLDFSKAFDLMRPDILANKLFSMNVSPCMIKLVTSFLANREQCVKYFECRSSQLPTKLGVPQGTISGPILWNVYVSDLNPSPNTIKYADDTTVYGSIEKKDVIVKEKSGRDRTISLNTDNDMQTAADNATQWSEDNAQRLNASKTQYVLFTLQLNAFLDHPITVNDQIITQSNDAKLLGVVLDRHLTFVTHVEESIKKSRGAVHGLLTLKRHGVNTSMLVKFYRTRVLSILTYAAAAWYTYTPQYARDHLERHQSLCLRIIYPNIDSYQQRMSQAGILPINEVLHRICTKYANKIVSSQQNNRLAIFVPPKQSSLGRHSERLADRRQFSARTALGSKSLFSVLS